MRPAALLMLCFVLAGCIGTRPPMALRTTDLHAPMASDANRTFSVRLGPHVLQMALPLLLARHAPHLPLYLRHLDHLYLSVYATGREADEPSAFHLRRPDWAPVLCLREEETTVWLLHPPDPDTLNRFALVIDNGDTYIVAYAEGRLLSLLRLALAAHT